MNLGQALAAGLEQLGLTLSAWQQEQLLDYLALMQKWNKVYNLTAVRDPNAMLYHHILDSLAVLPSVGTGRVLDVGSGPGLPGIPLAIAKPDLNVTLLDSNQKKATFQRQACIELGLRNAAVECVRVDAYEPSEMFDGVVSRAFSDLSEFVRLTARLCRPGGKLLAMKGVYPRDELARLPREFSAYQVVPLHVPGLDAQRHLVIIEV